MNDPDTFPAYFITVRENITERRDLEEDRDKQKIKTSCEQFKMITEETEPVIFKYQADKKKKLHNKIQYPR